MRENTEGQEMLADLMEKLGPAIPGIGLAIGVSPDGKRVRVDASKPLTYMDLLPEQAVALASVLQQFARQIEPEMKVGATGEFPEGKARPEDEGELRMMLRFDPLSGLVEIHFGKPVQWLAMQPEQMEEMARRLLDFAAANLPRQQGDVTKH